MSVGGEKRPLTLEQMLQRQPKPSARELFPLLRERLLDSRPVSKRLVKYVDAAGKNRLRKVTVHGAPTFRNVINEKGEHV